jgi:hypothetical protein
VDVVVNCSGTVALPQAIGEVGAGREPFAAHRALGGHQERGRIAVPRFVADDLHAV